MSGVTMGLAAAVFLTLSPFNIRFAQETRMYTLLAFNAAVAIYALTRLLTDPRAAMPFGSQFREYLHAWRTQSQPDPDSRIYIYAKKNSEQTGLKGWIVRHRWSPLQTIETDLAWVAWIVFTAATMLTHNTAVLFPLAVNIFVLGLILVQRKNKEETEPAFIAPHLGSWVKAQIGAFLLWSPWLYPFIQQAGRVYQEFWIQTPTWSTIIQVPKSFLNEFMPNQAHQVTIFWILYALVIGLGLAHYWKKMPRFLFLAALVMVPFVGELLVSIRRPIFYDRTLIWTTIPLFLALAAGIAQIKFRPLGFLVLAILGTNNLFSTSDYYRFMQKEQWDRAASDVAYSLEENDLILFNAGWVQIPFDYYYEDYINLYTPPVEKHGLPADMFERGILEPIMTESDLPRLLSLIDGRQRVWLVYSHNWYTDPQELIPRTLASEMKLIRQRQYYGVQVQLYAAPLKR